MKYVEVSYRSGGRVLTKRFPARSSGELWENKPDWYCCRICGYAVCSCAPQPVAPVPPADVLPEGWVLRPEHRYTYDHASGCCVSSTGTRSGPWLVYEKGRARESAMSSTRDAAMAAALASVQPAEAELDSPPHTPTALTDIAEREYKRLNRHPEPTLRAGWERAVDDEGFETYFRDGFLDVYRRSGTTEQRRTLPWRVCGDSNHPTLEAAFDRAEELARG